MAGIVDLSKQGVLTMYNERPNGEKLQARNLINQLLADGLILSVYDGEEWAVKMSGDFSAIWDALGNTDEDVIVARDSEKNLIGKFYLVWGNDPNGCELVADHSDNEYCNRVWNKLFKI
jgi:hypothetical protein